MESSKTTCKSLQLSGEKPKLSSCPKVYSNLMHTLAKWNANNSKNCIKCSFLYSYYGIFKIWISILNLSNISYYSLNSLSNAPAKSVSSLREMKACFLCRPLHAFPLCLPQPLSACCHRQTHLHTHTDTQISNPMWYCMSGSSVGFTANLSKCCLGKTKEFPHSYSKYSQLIRVEWGRVKFAILITIYTTHAFKLQGVKWYSAHAHEYSEYSNCRINCHLANCWPRQKSLEPQGWNPLKSKQVGRMDMGFKLN